MRRQRGRLQRPKKRTYRSVHVWYSARAGDMPAASSVGRSTSLRHPSWNTFPKVPLELTTECRTEPVEQFPVT